MPADSNRRGTILERILRSKRREVVARRARVPLRDLRDRTRDLPPTRDFRRAISRKGKEPVSSIHLIAEMKKASPSKGLLREDFDPRRLAEEYSEAGASALSVLTDSAFFQGSLEYLEGAKRWVNLPLLQKDFIIDEYQIWEGRVRGADAILLIAALLEHEVLNRLTDLALKIGLEPLIEIHSLSDLSKTEETRSRIIGINNRDLLTFQVNLETSFGLITSIGPGRSTVSESGIFTREEVMRLETAGLDAILVGEALMKSSDPGKKVRELLGRT